MGRCRRPILNREIHDQKTTHRACYVQGPCLLMPAHGVCAPCNLSFRPAVERDATRLELIRQQTIKYAPRCRTVSWRRTLLSASARNERGRVWVFTPTTPFSFPVSRHGCGRVMPNRDLGTHLCQRCLTASLAEPILHSFNFAMVSS